MIVICHFLYDIEYNTNPLLRFIINVVSQLKNLGKMNRNFLKEAIADAKAVKESAIANAKVALEEAFSPQVQAMFASKIEEMEKEDVKEAYDEVDEAKDDAKMEEGKEYMTKKERKEGDDRKSDNKAETETEKMRKLKEDDSNLDEILAELEKDEDLKEVKDKEIDEAKKDDDKEDIKEDERTDAEEEGYEDGMEDEKEDEDDEDIDLEDLSEEDLKKFIEDVIEDMVNAGEIEAGESFEDDVDVDVDVDGEIEVEDDEETSVDVAEAKEDIDEAKEEIDEKQGYDARLDDAEGAKHGKKKQDMKQRRADSENMEKALGERKFAGDSKMKEEMDKVKEELSEAYATVKTLKTELNEINLLNAKLLYTNKVFRGKNLTESQKVKVLGAFDKATNVKEVKLVFETIDGSVKTKVTNKSISEGFRSKGSASNMAANRKETKKQPIVESDEMVARFKKLAGII